MTSRPARPAAGRIIACIEDPQVIETILAHLDNETTESPGPAVPGAAAVFIDHSPPGAYFFEDAFRINAE